MIGPTKNIIIPRTKKVVIVIYLVAFNYFFSVPFGHVLRHDVAVDTIKSMLPAIIIVTFWLEQGAGSFERYLEDEYLTASVSLMDRHVFLACNHCCC